MGRFLHTDVNFTDNGARLASAETIYAVISAQSAIGCRQSMGFMDSQKVGMELDSYILENWLMRPEQNE